MPGKRSETMIKDPSGAAEAAKKLILDVFKEHAIGLYLNTKNKVIHTELISLGSLNSNIVHPREVFKPAIAHSAACIILVHNHPSGDPTPSRDDTDITKKLKEAGEILGIDFLDHVILGENRFYSMKEAGYL